MQRRARNSICRVNNAFELGGDLFGRPAVSIDDIVAGVRRHSQPRIRQRCLIAAFAVPRGQRFLRAGKRKSDRRIILSVDAAQDRRCLLYTSDAADEL